MVYSERLWKIFTKGRNFKMKKKLTAILTCLALTATFAGYVSAQDEKDPLGRTPCDIFREYPEAKCAIYQFKDIPGKDNPDHSDIEYCLHNGYMSGTSEDTFSPDATITRAQFVTMLYRVAGQPEVTQAANRFTDLTQDWYKKAINWAVSANIVSGTSSTTFSPNATITKEQILVMFYRAAKQCPNIDPILFTVGESLFDPNTYQVYMDVKDISPYAVEAVRWCLAMDIILADEPEYLQFYIRPKTTPTRLETADMLRSFDYYYNPSN